MSLHAVEAPVRRATPVARDVLVIVEDPALRELIAAHLRHQGHIVLPAAGAAEACRLIAEVQPDLVLLDGDTASAQDGALLQALTGGGDGPSLPVVLLASGAAHAVPLAARLRVTKPYRPQALVDAVQRLLQAGQPPQRHALPTTGRLRAGLLELDFELRAVRRTDAASAADLAPTELRLLQHLLQQPGRTHSRAELVDAVWGHGADVDARTVDQYVRRLREALQAVRADGALKTVRGVGYRIDLPALEAAA